MNVAEGGALLRDALNLRGRITAYERPEDMSVEEFLGLAPDEIAHRLAAKAEAENMVLNQYYTLLFELMRGDTAPFLTPNPAVSGLAFGIGAAHSTLTAALVSGTAYTNLPVTATPSDLLAGAAVVLTMGGNTQTVVTSAAVPAGSVNIPVNSFNANAAYDTTTAVSGFPVPVAHTDTALLREVAVTTLSAQIANGAVLTSIAVTALADPILSGDVLTLGSSGTTQTVTASADAHVGDIAIHVASFTANRLYAAGEWVGNQPSWRDRARASAVLISNQDTDPPQTIWSFFLPASSGTVNITEVGMLWFQPNGLYQQVGTQVVAMGDDMLMTHAAFAYAKPTNTDVRLDYGLTRMAA